MCNILGKLIFNFAIENMIRLSLRLGKFLRGLVQMGLEWICFFCVSLCLHVACVFALSRFFFCFFGFGFCLFLFLLIFVFSVFLCFFVFCIFVSLYSFQEIWVFSAHFQAAAVDCPSVFGYGETAKTRKNGYFAPTSSTPTLSETFKRCSFFKTQTQWPKLWADQWYERGSHYGKPPAHCKKKIPQKYFDVMLAPNIA